MIQISQDPVTRGWGFRIVSDLDSTELIKTFRPLYEDFTYDSPGTVYSVVAEIRKAVSENRFKVGKDGIICGYALYGYNNNVLMSEGGWTSIEDVNNHVNTIKSSLGEVKMMMLAQPKVIRIGDSSNNNNSGKQPVVSTYTDPITGEVKTYGGSSVSSQELLDRAKSLSSEDKD